MQQAGEPDLRIGFRRFDAGAQQREQRFTFTDLARRAALEPDPAQRRRQDAQPRRDGQRHLAGLDRVHARRRHALRDPPEHENREGRAKTLTEAGDTDQQAAGFFLWRIGQHGGQHAAHRRDADREEQCAGQQLRERSRERIEEEARREPKESEGVDRTSADLVGQRTEGSDQQQRNDFVGRTEDRQRTADLVRCDLQICVQQVRLDEADESQHDDGDERGDQVGRRVHAGVAGREAYRAKTEIGFIHGGVHQGTGLARSATEKA